VSKTIEPPVLVSKMLTFVLATAIVVLAVLGFTLIKMIPLERPEVFFLLTPTRSSNVAIYPMNLNNQDQAFYWYIRGFVREYIIARNTLYPGAQSYITRNNWSNVVKLWSSDTVFNELTKTTLYNAYTFNAMSPTMSCSVNFESTNNEPAIVHVRNNVYQANFDWICKDENIGGQTTSKKYKIQLRIDSELQKTTAGTVEDLEKLRKNPLGIQVVEYTVRDGKDDPLDSDMKSW